MKLEFSRQIFGTPPQIANFIKICPVEADGQTDRQTWRSYESLFVILQMRPKNNIKSGLKKKTKKQHAQPYARNTQAMRQECRISQQTSRIAASNVFRPRRDKTELSFCILITRLMKHFSLFPVPSFTHFCATHSRRYSYTPLHVTHPTANGCLRMLEQASCCSDQATD